MTGPWPQLLGQAFYGQSRTVLAAPSAERLLKEPQFSREGGSPEPLQSQQQQRPCCERHRNPTGVGVASLHSGWALDPGEGSRPTLSCGHPLVPPSARSPGRVRPATHCPGAAPSSPSSGARCFPQGSGLASLLGH